MWRLVHQWSFLLFWLSFDCFWRLVHCWYTVGTVLVDLWRLVHQWFWVFLTIGTVYHSSKTVKNSQKTVKQQKMTIGVPIITCLHRVRQIHKVRVCRIHKAVCAYQQCCHLANGNKTYPNLLVFKNNNMAHESRGFVGQSSRNSGTRVEQPSFFSELQYSAAFGHESKKFAGGVWKYAKFRHFLAHPVVTVL